MLSCLILSDGQVAAAYRHACEKIVGESENLYTIECDNRTPKMLHENIVNLIESKNLKDGLFILVSLRGDSCWNVAAHIVKKYEKVELISGLNLSLILSFVTKNRQYNFEDFGEVLAKDAARGICRLAQKALRI